MFCGNCGTKTEDGALFCPNCGARLGAPAPAQETIQQVTEQAAVPVQEAVQPAVEQVAAPVQEAVQPVVEQAAPVQEAVQPVVEQVAAPVQEAVQPVVEQVAAPVQEAVQPVVEQVAAPVQEAVQPVVEQAAAPVQEAVQPVVEQVAAPVQEAVQPAVEQAAAPVQGAAQQFPGSGQPMQEQAFNGMPMPGAAPAAPAAPVKKKKGKAGLIAGITAAAVVAGGAGVGYFGFHDKITRTMMGDAGYASMLTKAALNPGGNESEKNKAMNTVVSMAADSGMAAMMSTNTANSGSSESYEAAFDPGNPGSLPQAASDPRVKNMTANLFKGGDYREFLKELFSAVPENSTVTTTSGITVETGSMISGMTEGVVGDIIKKINELKFGSSMSNGATDRLAFTLSDKDGALATVEAYIEESGDVVLALPGISERTVRVQKSDIEKALGISEENKSQDSAEPLDLSFDEKEADRIRTEVVKILFASYDTAEIKFTDNVTYTLGEGEFRQEVKGTEVSVTLTAQQLKDVLGKVKEFLRDDAYLIGYAKDKFDIAEEDYKNLFKGDINVGAGLTLRHLADVHNNLLASSFTLTPDEGKDHLDIKVIGKETASLAVSYTDKEGKSASVLLLNSSKDGGKNGTVLLSVKADSLDAEFGVKVDYSNVGKAKWLEKEIPVGSYTIKLADPDRFVDSIKKLSGGGREEPDVYNEGMSNTFVKPVMVADEQSSAGGIDPEKLINELKKAEISFGSAVTGDTCTMDFSLSVGDIGKISTNMTAVKSGDTFTAPDKSKDIDLDSDADKKALTDDLTKWAQDAVKRLGLESLLGGMGGSSVNTVSSEKQKHYAAYDEYGSASYANTCAEKIYNGLNDTVAKTVASGLDSGVIRLYYKNGELNVLDDAGVPGINYTDSSFDSVYAEVIFDVRVSDTIAGVAVILTDDPYDLPAKTPDIFSFVDNVFPWDDYSNEIGEYIAGTYPVLYYGEPHTTSLIAKQRTVDELNDIAEDISTAVTRKLGSSGKLAAPDDRTEGGLTYVIGSDGDGRWSAWNDAEDSVLGAFAAGFTDMVGTYIVSPDRSDLTAVIYFYDGKFVGTLVFGGSTGLEPGDDTLPTAEDFAGGSYFGWYALDENDFVPTPGYTINPDGAAVHVGSYCAATQSELKWSDDNGSNFGGASDGISGTWQVVDQYGDFLVDDIVPSEVDMTAVIDDSSEPGTLGLTATGDVFRTYYFNKSVYFDGEYDIYRSLMDAEEENEPVGILWPESNGTMVICFINGEDQYTYYIINRGGDVSAGGTSDMSGTPKENPEIADITGRWTKADDPDAVTFAVSSNGIMTIETSLGYCFVNPKADGFDLYDDDMNIIGEMRYSEENDSVVVIDYGADNEETLFIRAGAPYTVDYMGDWVLYSVNGTTMEDIAKRNNRKVEDITSYMTISEYDIILSNAEGRQILIISAYDDAYFVENPGDNLMETGKYDDSEETITVTQTELKADGTVDESSASTVLVFKRSL